VWIARASRRSDFGYRELFVVKALLIVQARDTRFRLPAMGDTSFSQLGRNTMLYTLCSLVQRAVGFLLLPVYTRYLTPADYGVLQLLDITVDIAAILFVSGMTAGLQRYYFAAKDEAERKQVVSTTYVLELGLGAVATMALFLAAPLAAYIGLREPQHVMFVRISAINFLLSVLLSVPLLLLQTQKRAGAFLLASMGKLILQVTLNLTCLIGLGLGVVGMLYSGLVVNAIVGLVLAIWLMRSVGLHFSMPMLRKLRSFGVPYQISTAGSFILVFGDRFFLGHNRSIGEVGLYGLAYQFGFLLSSLVEGPFCRAWNPMRFQQVELPRSERDRFYNQGLRILGVVLILVATGIVLYTPAIIRLATTAEFYPAAVFVPILIGAYIAQCYTMVVAFGIDVSTRTKYYTYATWISSVLIVLLYASLIPPFGGLGAAWATLLAFLVRFALTYYFAQQVWPVSYEWGTTLQALVIGGVVCMVAWMLPPMSLITGVVVDTLLFLLCVVAIWLVVLNQGDRTVVLTTLRRMGKRVDAVQREPGT
jgi:O-antigen/teichoic acid export membrane protein